MKKYSLVLWFSMLLSLFSCNKDLGNYSYNDINTFTIGGIEENYLVRALIDTLRIDPLLTMSLPDTDPARYDYRWLLRLNIQTVDRFEDTISRDAKLVYPINLAETDYKLILQVYDKETKMVWEKSTLLQVKSSTSRGIMLIGEDQNQKAEVDMVAMVNDTTVIRGLLSKSGLPSLRNPVAIQHTGGTLARNMKLWVLTGDGSYFLNRTQFTGNPVDNFSKISYTNLSLTQEDLTPVVLAPQINSITGGVSEPFARIMLTKTGYIFGGNTLENGGDFYVTPINKDANNPNVYLPAAPYLFYPIKNANSMLWYDTKNDRFMNIASFYSNTASLTFTDKEGEVFPWNQGNTGRKLVYGENTVNIDGGGTNGNSYALMKDQQQYTIYKFYANGASSLKLGAFPIKPIAQDFDRASSYAFASYRTLLFYVVDNKLYAYDYNPGNEKLHELHVTGADAITMIKFDTQINPSVNSLYIATYNASSKGTLQRFTLGTNPNTVELLPVEKDKWSNLVKIKNMSWRAVN